MISHHIYGEVPVTVCGILQFTNNMYSIYTVLLYCIFLIMDLYIIII